MELFPINLNGTDYEVIDTIKLNNKNYIAYTDYTCIFINEFVIENNRMNLLKIDEKVFEEVRKVMNL